MKILLIEDNPDILKNLSEYFNACGYITDCAEDGLTGLHLAATQDFDLIILDLMLPGIDGITLCRRLRTDAQNQTPIIMLTARDRIEDKLEGFEAGADDYLVKPFDLSELKARLEAVIKRSRNVQDGAILKSGDLILNTRTLELHRGDNPIKVGPTAIKILECLMRASPDLVKKGILEEFVWGDTLLESDVLRVHIHSLRQAIDKPFNLNSLLTVSRVGYRLVDSSK